MNRANFLAHAICLLLLLKNSFAADPVTVSGQIVDADGKPAADIDVASFWSANGLPREADGTVWTKGTKLEQKLATGGWEELHRHVGVMEPHWPSASTRTDTAGHFALEVNKTPTALLAMDRTRTKGAVILVETDALEIAKPVVLGNLVDVRGRMRCIGVWKKPLWSNVYVGIYPDEVRRPLDYFRLLDCSSLNADFAFKVPVGNYHLQVYSSDPETHIKGVHLAASGKSEIDSGTIELNRKDLLYRQHFGKPPPKWLITDARGVDKSVQPANFKGKWVVLEFWNLSCVDCLKHQLPEWADFYRSRAKQHDAFEILGICVDVSENLESMADVQKGLAPIVVHTWKGHDLPFPLLLDAKLRTWQSYGLESMGDTLLIDPQGNLTSIVGHDEVRDYLTKQLDAR